MFCGKLCLIKGILQEANIKEFWNTMDSLFSLYQLSVVPFIEIIEIMLSNDFEALWPHTFEKKDWIKFVTLFIPNHIPKSVSCPNLFLR